MEGLDKNNEMHEKVKKKKKKRRSMEWEDLHARGADLSQILARSMDAIILIFLQTRIPLPFPLSLFFLFSFSSPLDPFTFPPFCVQDCGRVFRFARKCDCRSATTTNTAQIYHRIYFWGIFGLVVLKYVNNKKKQKLPYLEGLQKRKVIIIIHLE